LAHRFDLERAIQRAFDSTQASADAAPPSEELPLETVSPSATEDFRTWTDSTGEYRVEARLVSVENGMARLLKKNGKYTSVPVARLSKTDAEFIRRWAAAPRL
jgi:hypothetical protein